MAKKESRITLCLGSFVYIKEKANKKKTRTLGYIRAKNSENGNYAVVTVMSSISNSTVNAAQTDIEAIPVTLIKQALYEAECDFSFSEYCTFVRNYNAFEYKLVTIPQPVENTEAVT